MKKIIVITALGIAGVFGLAACSTRTIIVQPPVSHGQDTGGRITGGIAILLCVLVLLILFIVAFAHGLNSG